MRQSRLHTVAAIAAVLWVGLAGTALSQTPPAVVAIDEVLLEPVEQTALAIGRFVTLHEATVPALVPSYVTETPVIEGDRVDTGQVLAILDVDRLGWMVRQAEAVVLQREADLSAARARADAAQRRLDRAEGLRESTAFSEAQRDDLRGETEELQAMIAASEAGLKVAQANLDLAQDDFRHGTVRAPFAGVVEERHADLGEAVQPGSPVATLISDTDLEVEVEVPSRRLNGIDQGTPIRVSLVDGTEVLSQVRAVGAVENPRTRTRRVRLSLSFPQEMRSRAVGESVEVHVPIGSGSAVPTVHKDAILKRQGMSLVYVVAEGAAQIRPVELGDAVRDRFVVLSGVSPGEVVVVRGNERLRPGQEVTMAPPGGGGPPPGPGTQPAADEENVTEPDPAAEEARSAGSEDTG